MEIWKRFFLAAANKFTIFFTESFSRSDFDDIFSFPKNENVGKKSNNSKSGIQEISLIVRAALQKTIIKEYHNARIITV